MSYLALLLIFLLGFWQGRKQKRLETQVKEQQKRIESLSDTVLMLDAPKKDES